MQNHPRVAINLAIAAGLAASSGFPLAQHQPRFAEPHRPRTGVTPRALRRPGGIPTDADRAALEAAAAKRARRAARNAKVRA